MKKENSVFSHGALSTISRDISVKLKRAPSSQAKATAIQLQCSCARCLFKPKKKRARVLRVLDASERWNVSVGKSVRFELLAKSVVTRQSARKRTKKGRKEAEVRGGGIIKSAGP